MRSGQTGWISPGSGTLGHDNRRMRIQQAMSGKIRTSWDKVKDDDEANPVTIIYKEKGKPKLAEITVEVSFQRDRFERGEVSEDEFSDFLSAARQKLKERHPEYDFFQKPHDDGSQESS